MNARARCRRNRCRPVSILVEDGGERCTLGDAGERPGMIAAHDPQTDHADRDIHGALHRHDDVEPSSRIRLLARAPRAVRQVRFVQVPVAIVVGA